MLPDKRSLTHGMCLYQVMMTLHFLMASLMTLNQHKIENYVIIADLKSKTMGKLINGIPGSGLLITSLPGSALRTNVELLSKPRDVNMRSQSLAW